MRPEPRAVAPAVPGAVLILAALPFYLNDLTNILVHDYARWLAWDLVLVKLLPLLVLWWGWRRGAVDLSSLGFRGWRPRAALVWFLAAAAGGVVLDTWTYGPLEALLPETAVGAIPVDEGSPLYRWDMLLGLPLVSVMEEAVFRGLAYTTLRRWFAPLAAGIWASLLFGAIHWSGGLAAVLVTACIGGLFQLAAVRSRSLVPTIAAHTVVNWVSFLGLP
jgi:hypothetical protein